MVQRYATTVVRALICCLTYRLGRSRLEVIAFVVNVLEDRVMSELLGIARFKFLEGKREEYLRLSDQAAEIVRAKDSGTLAYDLYLNGDQSECMFIERYRDSEAAIEHAANLGHLFDAVLATVSVVHGELLGEPSEELRAKLAGSDVPVLFTPYRSR
jgi:quinol monooxygenase YgiN